jgi:hypothetical protein
MINVEINEEENIYGQEIVENIFDFDIVSHLDPSIRQTLRNSDKITSYSTCSSPKKTSFADFPLASDFSENNFPNFEFAQTYTRQVEIFHSCQECSSTNLFYFDTDLQYLNKIYSEKLKNLIFSKRNIYRLNQDGK